MYLGLQDYRAWDRPWEPVPSPIIPCRWTVLIPFFNERDYLADTLASLAAQDVPFELILIDNGSTDGSGALATSVCQRLGLNFTLLHQSRPGKVNALRTGVVRTRTIFVATCDADTLYPRNYLSEAALLLERGAVAAGAYFVSPGASQSEHVEAGRRIMRAARLFPGQCHTGGAGQVFRTGALRRVGQFNAQRWGYVLEDHEILHRIAKQGPLAYSDTFWCAPSARERDRDSIRWTLAERVLYHVTPRAARDWFFYEFLVRRLAGRRLTSDRIRERQFHAEDCGLMTLPIAA